MLHFTITAEIARQRCRTLIAEADDHRRAGHIRSPRKGLSLVRRLRPHRPAQLPQATRDAAVPSARTL